MTIDDVALLVRWDDDPDVTAALGGRGADWYDWPAELIRDVPWRELLVAEEDGRPIGFVQVVDASEEESHYWGEIDNRRAIAFYEKLGFERVGVREFGDDVCLVMRLLRSSAGSAHQERATR